MSHGVKVCDISADVKKALEKFRFRRDKTNAALIMKVDREKQMICIDEIMEDVSVDELRENLPEHQPRYVVFCYKMEHGDGRISYPMSFIFITPRDSQIELQIMYAGTKMALQKEAGLTRAYEIRELEEFTEDWLKEKLSK
ncbi:glia maturation factor [Hetaerina americana]|uniref:glia maturation factor n=1 Tax=Hetaerina americana TaxID=62018 RepID=UPI003A7F4D95